MSSLRSKASSALAWDLVGNYGAQITGFVISIFLSRLLEPKEFGLVGMSLVFINILKVFTDVGFASALVQNKVNTSITYSSVFYVNLIFGFVLFSIVFLCAPLIGKFYENETVTGLIHLLSITLLLNSLNIVQRTILRRNLAFKIISIRDLTSQLIAGVLAVFLAYRGFGVYALVLQQILAALINSVILWKVTEWYPRFEFSWIEVKKLTGFSTYVFAAQSMNQLIMQADTLVIGKLFSPATLGFFSRANSVNSLITKNSVASISKVFFPVLSTIQDDDERFKKVYLSVINIVSGIAIFLTGVFFLSGEELIIGLFGEKWRPSVLIFQILIVKGFTFPINAMIVNAFLAKGKSRANFRYGNIRKAIHIIPLSIAYFYGFFPFLYALAAASIVNWLLTNWFVTITLGISYLSQLKGILPQLIVSIFFVVAINIIFPTDFSFIIAFLKVITFSVLYVIFQYASGSILFREIVFYKNKLWSKLRST